MITIEQAIRCETFHAGKCERHRGPRGGITEKTETWRRNGKTQTWKTRPDEYRTPIKYGLKACDQLTQRDAHLMHAPEDCPLNDPNYFTTDLQPKDEKTDAL